MGRYFTLLLILVSYFLAVPLAQAQTADETVPVVEAIEPTLTPPVDPTTNTVLEPMGKAVLQTLDKVTGRTGTATVKVGETVKLGTLYLTVKTCRKAPPIEEPEAAAFVQVWQSVRDNQGKTNETPESEWVFSGWMFASSPSISAMDHPIYDVWVIDCK